MMMKVAVTKGEDGYFVARCPSLKSCWSQGKTRDDALKNIREAIKLYLEPDPIELTIVQENDIRNEFPLTKFNPRSYARNVIVA